MCSDIEPHGFATAALATDAARLITGDTIDGGLPHHGLTLPFAGVAGP
jgi:hypothetical protein